MAILNIVKEGDDVLRKTCRPVDAITPRILTLLDDMLETLHDANGVGLAAPQVTYMMHALAKTGMPVDTEATTIAEAVETISKALEK